jgi:hypothetical protein
VRSAQIGTALEHGCGRCLYHTGVWELEQSLGLRSSGLLRGVSGQSVGPETSVNNYQHKLLNNPEERRPHLHRGGSLWSRIGQSCVIVLRV